MDRSSVVVATTLGMWLPGRDGRLGWHQIHKATWAPNTLTVVAAKLVGHGDGYDVFADDAPVAVRLATPGDVPAEVRKRVTTSVAATAHHPVPGGGVRVVARRTPGRDGVSWHVRYDEGVDIADPEVVAATVDALTRLT